MKKFVFSGKLAVVTGASSGIGEAVARVLHQRGCHLLLIARRHERLEQVARELNSRRPETVETHCADCSQLQDSADRMGIPSVVELIRKRCPAILVNNAGRGAFGYFEQLDVHAAEEMLRLNCQAALAFTHAAIPSMKEKQDGAIVFLSSIAAFQPLPLMATYAATKAFDLVFAESLWGKVQESGVHVLTVCPGPVDTEFGGVARVPGELTGLPRDAAGDVATEIVNALRDRTRCLVPGRRGKLFRAGLFFLPRGLRIALTFRMLRKSLVLHQSRTR